MILLGFVFLICLIFSPLVKNGIKNGLILLTDQVIPSLYPFVLITTYINKKYNTLNSYLLIGMSIFSGYPVGAKIIAEHSFLDIPITKQDLLMFCNNPSLPYLISYVGGYCLNSPLFGLIIYICIISGNILTLFLKFLLKSIHPVKIEHSEKIRLCSTTCKYDTLFLDTFHTLINLSSYILIFSIFTSLINNVSFIPYSIRLILICLTETTTGIAHLSKLTLHTSYKLVWITGMIGFGGMSVILQTSNMTKDSTLSIKKYMTDKAISSLIAMSVMYGLTYLIT